MTRLVPPYTTTSQFSIGPFHHKLSISESCNNLLSEFHIREIANAKSHPIFTFLEATPESHLAPFRPSSWSLSNEFLHNHQFSVKQILFGLTPDSLDRIVVFTSFPQDETNNSSKLLPYRLDTQTQFKKAIRGLTQAHSFAFRVQWADHSWSDVREINRLDPTGKLTLSSAARELLLKQLQDKEPVAEISGRQSHLNEVSRLLLWGLSKANIAIDTISYDSVPLSRHPFEFRVSYRDKLASDAPHPKHRNAFTGQPPLTSNSTIRFSGRTPLDALPLPRNFETAYLTIVFKDGSVLRDIPIPNPTPIPGAEIPHDGSSIARVFFYCGPDGGTYPYSFLVQLLADANSISLRDASGRTATNYTNARYTRFRLHRNALVGSHRLSLIDKSGASVGSFEFQLTSETLARIFTPTVSRAIADSLPLSP